MKLVDVEKRNKQNPTTFTIPPSKDRKSLKVGNWAKLIFDDKERMWVKITKVDSPGVYRGVLDNEPVVVDLKLGDKVEFTARNIADFLE